MARVERSFEVAGVGFRFALEVGPTGRSVAWPVPGLGHEPLCHAVATAWLHSPGALLDSLDERVGRSYEGAVGWSFGDEDPDELPPGVTASWLGRDVAVDEAFFASFVRAFGLAFLDAAREAGSDPSALEPIRRRLAGERPWPP